MTTGIKVWLWITLIIYIIGCLSCILLGSIGLGYGWVLLVVYLAVVVGDVLLLFKNKKVGFYVIAVVSILSIFINIAMVPGVNIIKEIISGILFPSITYFIMKRSWDEFA